MTRASDPATLNGAQSETSPVARLLLKHARDAFVDQATVDAQWKPHGYLSRPDFRRAEREYEGFLALFGDLSARIDFLPPAATVSIDSIYVRDAAVVCSRGIILCNMGKPERSGEPAALEDALPALGLPLAGAITGAGRLEGGDVVWLDDRTIAVGRGYRTNEEGIRQLRQLLGSCVDTLAVVPLPHWRGPGDVFHLMSVLSPLDHDLVLAYSPLLPVTFREWLLERGTRLVEVSDEEFPTMGCNVLAVAPRRCIMLAGNPVTRSRLEAAGVEVRTYEGGEISRKGAGGPTCLTRPIERHGPASG